MTEQTGKSKAAGFFKWVIVLASCFLVVGLAVFFYIQQAFPVASQQDFEHLEIPEQFTACVDCHKKVTPKIAEDWKSGKHGVMLVKCFVCHGQPDEEGSVPFAVDPDVDAICRKCHDPAINKMQVKYGLEAECNSCHPYHHNSLHHKAYTKTEAKTEVE